jgi:hypothetical protein
MTPLLSPGGLSLRESNDFQSPSSQSMLGLGITPIEDLPSSHGRFQEAREEGQGAPVGGRV